jgi:hypothetical protein
MTTTQIREAIMIKIYLTTDPATGRGLYDSEARLLGRYTSIGHAESELGDILRFCSIRSALDHSNS